jgi:5'-nucleotidase
MRILLTNDDGIGAAGLTVLEEIAKTVANEIFVVAPDSNMSGAGHSLTLKTPLRLHTYDDHHFSVSGTPTDSVLMAIKHVMHEKPDIVLSGINCDANLAEDITYSGTVAAAMEARILGVPSIAFSQNVPAGKTINWDVAKKYCPQILKSILDQYTFPSNVLLNINFPSADVDDVKGIRVTHQGFRAGEDHLIQSVDPRGDKYFWVGGAEYRRKDKTMELSTDLGAINNGFISVTPVSFDFTAISAIESLEKIFI